MSQTPSPPAETDDLDRAAEAAAGRFPGRAEAAGLVDVAYARVDSPLGELLAAATPQGLVRLAYLEDRSENDVLEALSRRVSPRLLEVPARLDPVRRELDEYFEGSRRRFGVALDRALIGPFARRVLASTAAIPYGGYLTYREVAAEAGSPRGARAAGNALGSNPMPIVIPCHRVLATGGGLGGYTGGLHRKEELLRREGAWPR
jgi:methylated-DNA-[protein]-cysteine S-methyltransferase